MADPTIKDVLEAVRALGGEVAEVRRDVGEIRRDVKALDARVATLDRKVETLDAKVEAGFARVDKSIVELGEDIDKHMVVHKTLEKQVDTLKAKPARPAVRMPRRR